MDLYDSLNRTPDPIANSDSQTGITYTSPSEPVWVHDNYYGVGDAGYGVAVGNGAHALIERNVFDAHRHARAADPTDRTGYRACDFELMARRGSEGLAPIPSDQTRRVPAGTGQPRERLVLAP